MSWILLTLSAKHCSPGLTQVYARAQRSCQGNSHREGKPHWHRQACLLSLPRGTAEKPGVHGSPVLPKLPELQLPLCCTWATLQGPAFPRLQEQKGAGCPQEQLPSSHQPKPAQQLHLFGLSPWSSCSGIRAALCPCCRSLETAGSPPGLGFVLEGKHRAAG